MNSIYSGLILAAVIAIVGFLLIRVRDWFLGLLGSPGSSATAGVYKARPFLLSKAEAAFYHTLRAAVDGRYLIAPKVRLSDVITCSGDAWRAGHGNRIVQKHLDFVLCDPKTTRIVAAIELDDGTHARSDRRQRDEFLAAALRSAAVPLLRFEAGQFDVGRITRAMNELGHGASQD